MLTGGAYLGASVDPVDAGGEGFMLYNTRSGKVRYYRSSPRRPSRGRWSGSAYDRRSTRRSVLRSVYIYCYTGVRGGSSDSHHESEAREQRAHPGVLEVFPISGDPGRLYEATETFGVERLFVTTSAVYLQSNSQLYSADLADAGQRVLGDQPAGRFGGGRRPAVLDYRMGDLRVRRGRAQYPAAVHRREAADVETCRSTTAC